MKIIHTSDWHLGALFYERKTHALSKKFLNWLEHLLLCERPDLLLITGDIYDSCSPSSASKTLLHDFLGHVYAEKTCPSIILVGGNHDSPAVLEETTSVLNLLNTHVIGDAPMVRNSFSDHETSCRQIIPILSPEKDQLLAVVCAVPFLRDRELISSMPLEDENTRTLRREAALADYYANLFRQADTLRRQAWNTLAPIILTGHLFFAEATISDDESERFRGSLQLFPLSILPPADYVALGHLHRPQCVGKMEHIRYAGAPLKMSFREAYDQKSVSIISFPDKNDPEARVISQVPVPDFQTIRTVEGSLNLNDENAIYPMLKNIARNHHKNEKIWCEITISSGNSSIPTDQLERAWCEEFPDLDILCIRDLRPEKSSAGTPLVSLRKLNELRPEDVFSLRMAEENLDENMIDSLMNIFRDVTLECEKER